MEYEKQERGGAVGRAWICFFFFFNEMLFLKPSVPIQDGIMVCNFYCHKHISLLSLDTAADKCVVSLL